MTKYVICPKCGLNYIKADEAYCKVCDPKMRGKLISDDAEKSEAYRQEKLEQYEARKLSMQAFYSIRYNRTQKNRR